MCTARLHYGCVRSDRTEQIHPRLAAQQSRAVTERFKKRLAAEGGPSAQREAELRSSQNGQAKKQVAEHQFFAYTCTDSLRGQRARPYPSEMRPAIKAGWTHASEKNGKNGGV